MEREVADERATAHERIGISWALVAVLLGAVALRVPMFTGTLPDLYWHDELNFIEGALRIGAGEIRGASFGGYAHGTLTFFLLFGAFAFWFVLGRAVGLFAGVNDFVLAYASDPTPFILVVRAITLAASVGTVGLTYVVGRWLFGARAGLFAALLFAGSFQSIHMTYGKEDSLFALLMLAAYLSAVCAMEAPQKPWRFVAAGAAVAAASAVKYFGLAGFGLLAVAALLGSWPNLRAAARNAGWAVAGFVVAFVCFMPAVLLDTSRLVGSFLNLREGNAGILVEAPSGGGAWYGYLWTTYAVAGGVVLTALFYAGAAVLLRERNRAGVLLLVYPAGLITALTTVLLFGKGVEVPYYQLSTVPFLCLAAGRLLDRMTAGGTPLRVAAYGLAALAVAGNVSDAIRFQRLIHAEDSRTSARKWIETHVPSGASILMEGAVFTFVLEAPQLKETPAALTRDLKRNLEQGGSGRMAQAKLRAVEESGRAGPRYDLHKVYNLTAEDIERYPHEYVVARSEAGRRVIEASTRPHQMVFSVQPPHPRLFQIVPLLSIADIRTLQAAPLLSEAEPHLTMGPSIWVFRTPAPAPMIRG
ncbi:MAG: hypothetical protein FJ245_05280 [Nitrospira sp.]|nr:hypothetical protein [Nitrospira sp.]